MQRLARIAAVAALSSSALAFAAARAPDLPTGPAPGRVVAQMLQKLDTDGDGRVSLDEYLAAASARFDAADSAHQGSVDAADIAASPAALERMDRHAEAIVRHLDTSGAGYVTADEFAAAAQKRFARLDRNGDGRLTPDELGGPRRGHHRGAGAGGAASERFARLDANHDGSIDAGEYVAAARSLYAQLDAQQDGKVTAAELAESPRAQQRALRAANRLVAHADANGDGRVTREEFLAATKARFARMDRDGDGFLEAGELHGPRHGRRGMHPQG